ncbi:MAG TPA: rhomboid family intramembrane serine protease [Vicinamibacterales bacterium]|nr:rhomboid family intramembrane serine protease [Vicinamibacterales bacterium]
MIPIRDVIPSRTTPLVTVLIILINAAVFLYQQTLGEAELTAFVYRYALVPVTFSLPAVLTSMFMHGDWMHFLGNMWFLWIFGDNVEDRVGHGRFVPFYLLCGAAAALAQVWISPASRVPMVGASGGIAGVMGAYFVMFPHSRVLTLVPIFFFIELIEVPAIFFLGIWFLLQFLSGVTSLGVARAQDVGGVAFWAHVAGFVAGVIWIFVFRRPERQRVEWFDM